MRCLQLIGCWLLCGTLMAEEHATNLAPWLPPAGANPTTVIDLLLEAEYRSRQVIPNDRCTDAAFVRRVYLDVWGRIPCPQERASFLSRTDSAKRSQLIDDLLASPAYAEHMAASFDTMLMGRAERQIAEREKHGWNAFLERVFRDNRPWNDVVREVLLARGESTDRGHLWFLYERKNQHQEISEAVARTFFGVDIGCAQCHDHPLAEEIHQIHYWGLVSFFQRSKNTTSVHGIAVSESAIGGFDEFSNALSGSTERAVLTFLQAPVVSEDRPQDPQQQADHDELYEEVENEPRVPHFSRREMFVDKIVSGHPRLARAMVNRIWALLMGRGIVHPVDKMDSNHPPSHPMLLDWLARDFAGHGYDVKRLMGAILNSRAYQSESQVPPDADPSSFAYSLEKPLTAESFARSLAIVLQTQKAEVEAAVGTELRALFPQVAAENNLTSLKQTMSLSNYPPLQRLFAEAGTALANEEAETSTHDVVNALIERVYGRLPRVEETTALRDYLQARSDRLGSGYAQVLWALTTSAEFRFNH